MITWETQKKKKGREQEELSPYTPGLASINLCSSSIRPATN